MRFVGIFVLVVTAFFATDGSANIASTNASVEPASQSCLTVKSRVSHTMCTNPALFVNIHSNCSQKLDIKTCIQKDDGWDCGLAYNIDPGESTTYWACNGVTGRYKYFTRAAGSNAAFPEP